MPSGIANPSIRSRFGTGVRAGAGPAAANFVLALTYGAGASAKGWGTSLPLLFSMFAWSSSAQFTLLYVMAAGSAMPGIIAASLVNARYMVMSIALSSSLRGGRLRGAVQAQALADASFAIAHQGRGAYGIPELVGASCPQWLCWVTGTWAGLTLAPSTAFIHTFGLDTTLPAFFLVLTLGQMRASRAATAAALLGAAITAAASLAVSPGIALLAASAAAGIALLPSADATRTAPVGQIAPAPEMTLRQGGNR